MFLFALVAAAFADTTEARRHRGALHELARRLEGAEPTRTPPSFRDLVQSLVDRAETPLDAMAVEFMIGHLSGDDLQVEQVFFPHGLGVLSVFPKPGAEPAIRPWFAWGVGLYREVLKTTDGAVQMNRHVARLTYFGIFQRIFDWAMTHPVEEALSLSIQEAVARSQAWHQELVSLRDTARTPKTGTTVARFKDGATIQRLWTRAQLDAEGKAMGHCVGSHHASVTRGDSRVFSYRDPKGMSRATIEVTGPYNPSGLGVELLDLEGPENEDVPFDAADRVRRWLLASGIDLGELGSKVDDFSEPVHRLAGRGLFGDDRKTHDWKDRVDEAWSAQKSVAGYDLAVVRYDAELTAALRVQDREQARAILRKLINALDLGTILYLTLFRAVESDAEDAAHQAGIVPVASFAVNGSSIEGVVGWEKDRAAAVLYIPNPEVHMIAIGASLLSALRQAHVLETVDDRVARLSRHERALERTGLIERLPFEVAHASDRATVEAAGKTSG